MDLTGKKVRFTKEYKPISRPVDESLGLKVRLKMKDRTFREVAPEIGIRPTTLCSAYHGKKPGMEQELNNLLTWLENNI
ncbi:hypothetical protein [Nostoc sp. FACHB-280]|uniref:hypothetical protein n=1 Tax=Nostoc sp. FACHB-280 TaxID=2692839 RepID=UPI00168B22A0|nr:hypothetical protein [Nostoc sp. FACHB-280]MBD2498193.1 hypothetical protein [Nostoc sp. FACHB-280]